MGRTYQSTVINAPLERVWSAIRDFHNMDWAPSVITDLEVVGDKPGNEIGATRVLNGAFRETLLELDEEVKTFRYSIDDGPSPVSASDVKDYVGQVVVRPITEGGGTFVEWSSTWEQNDQPVYEFCRSIYVALLGDMKNSME